MPTITFASAIQHQLPAPPVEVVAPTVRDAFQQVFAQNPRLRGYLLDDQGALRTHLVVFVDGVQIADRVALGDPLRATSRVHVLQALSGG
jgi:hypothetical protein